MQTSGDKNHQRQSLLDPESAILLASHVAIGKKVKAGKELESFLLESAVSNGVTLELWVKER